MLPPSRPLRFALVVAAASFPTSSATAQQMTTGNIVAVGAGAAYFALGIASLVRLAGHAREARVGDRVRGRPKSVDGTLAAVDADSITIRSDAGETRLPRADVGHLRVSEGREHKWAQGWGIGLLTGAAVGVAIGAASEAPADDPGCEFICPTREEDIVFGGLAVGVTGSILGAAIGAATVGERWSRIDRFAARTSLEITPHWGALRIGGRVRF